MVGMPDLSQDSSPPPATPPSRLRAGVHNVMTRNA